MKLFNRSLLLFCIFLSFISGAQQLAGGEITYTCIGNDQYQVKLVLYAKCPNPNLPASVNLSIFSSSNTGNVPSETLNQSGSDQIIRACLGKSSACEGGTGETADAITKRVYTGTVKLPKKLNDWQLIVQEGPRTKISNVKDQNLMNLTAMINNTGTLCNSSPTFDNNPPFFASSELLVSNDPGLKSPDGDKLQAQLVTPRNSVQQPISYNTNFSANAPFSSSGPVTLDPNTGKLTFTPNKPGETSTLAIQVKDIRNGVEVGNVMREMYFQAMPKLSNPPYFNGPDTVKICLGDPVNLYYEGLSNNTNAQLDILLNNKNADWPSATVSVTKSNGKAILNVSSSALAINTVRALNLTLVDDNCGMVTKTVYVKVYPKPSISNINNRDTTVLCLNPFPLTINASGGVKPYTYTWENKTETTNKITVTEAGTYRVSVKDVNGCTAVWTKRVLSPINFAKGQIACVDSNIAFYDVSLGLTNPVRHNPQPKTTTWKWSFGDNSPVSTLSSPKHKFPESDVVKTYNVTMEISDGAGCVNSISKPVKIFPKPKVPYVFVDSCQATERSDLKVQDAITSDTTIKPINIEYFVNGNFHANAVDNRNPSRLFVGDPGLKNVTLTVKDDAGCVNSLTKKVVVGLKPRFVTSPARDAYFYRCDLPGFPDTSFAYRVTANTTAQPVSIQVSRTGLSSISNNNTSGILLTIPYTVVQNTKNEVLVQANDALGCTNDTATVFVDPINPKIRLSKYYCFEGDTLKLRDSTLETTGYHWGLTAANWNMRDGEFENTIGFANHRYSLKSLDEANIILGVRDNTGCTDTTTYRAYLSEPDTSQFNIDKPLACFAEPITISGIKNPYINSWYFKYRDTVSQLYINFDREVINRNFGASVPPNIDEVQKPESDRYIASTLIFYNEKNPLKNFERDPNFLTPVIKLPKTIAQPEVCRIEMRKNWRVVERLRYSVIDTIYNKCFGFDKEFKANLIDSSSVNMRVVDNSWKWSLHSPANTLLETKDHVPGMPYEYNASAAKFSEVVSPRATVNRTLYTVKIKYNYTNDSITCTDSSSVKVMNEKVSFVMDPNFITCSNYSVLFQFTKPEFLDGLERSNTIWSYGDGEQDTANQVTKRYELPNTYKVVALATNKYGCTATDSLEVRVKPSPRAILKADPVCDGTYTILNGSESTPADTSTRIVSYYWYYSPAIPPTADPNVPDTTKAIRTTLINQDTIQDLFPIGSNPVGLVVRDANGCFAQAPIVLAVVNPNPEVSFTALAKSTQDEDFLGHEAIEFKPVTENADIYKWDFGNGDIKSFTKDQVSDGVIEYTYPFFAPPFPKERNIYDVILQVSTKEGCMNSAKKKIDVNAYFEMPNAFSPNEDGLHDNFLGIGKGIREIKEFKVFNRWGEVIHSVMGTPEKDALKKGYLLWDGVYNGQVQPVGVYVYYAVVKTGYGDEIIKKGNLTLLK